MAGAGEAIWASRLGGHMLGEGVLKAIMSWTNVLAVCYTEPFKRGFVCNIGMDLRVYDLMV